MERTALAQYAANLQNVRNSIDAIQAVGRGDRMFFASSQPTCPLDSGSKDGSLLWALVGSLSDSLAHGVERTVALRHSCPLHNVRNWR